METAEVLLDQNEEDLSAYAGRWIALIGNHIIGQGGTPQQAMRAAKASRFKENPRVSFVPTPEPLAMNPLFERIRTVLPSEPPVYLVGGAVRDALLGRQTHDMDFVLHGDALAIASAMNVGGHLVDLSPLSTLGALSLAALPPTVDARKVFNQLLAWGLSMTVVGAVICWIMF